MRTFTRRGFLSLVMLLALVVAPAQAQLRITNAAASAAANAIVDLLDAGPGNGTLHIFSGTCPASAGDADPSGELVELTFAATAFGSATNGVATAASITGGTATGTGIAACFRAKDGAGTTIFQGAVTGDGGGGQMELINTSIATGQTVNISSMTLTVPTTP